MFLPNWTNGLDTAVDVTVISSLQQALVEKAAETPGAALAHAFERNNRQSLEVCRELGIHLATVPVEVLGGWHFKSVILIKKLARQFARQLGKDDRGYKPVIPETGYPADEG